MPRNQVRAVGMSELVIDTRRLLRCLWVWIPCVVFSISVLTIYLAFSLFLAAAQVHTAASMHEAAESHVGRGYELIQSYRYQEAARQFGEALAINPNLVRARYQLGVCLFALHELPKARHEFEVLARDTSNNPKVVYYLGRLDLMQGKPEVAIKRFSVLITAPPFKDTLYYLGTAYFMEGNLKAAEKWLKAAAAADPHDYRIPDHIARVYQKMGQKAEAEKEYKLSEAIRQRYNEATAQAVACSQALETEPLKLARQTCQRLFIPGDSARLTTLGMLYGRHGYYADALAPLQAAVKIDPDSFGIQHDLGFTLFRLGRYQDALGPLEKAVSFRPDFFASNALLGAALFMLHEDAKGLQVLEHAHQLNPKDAGVANLLFSVDSELAREQFAAKKYQQALQYLQEAERLRPKDPQTHKRLADIYRLLDRAHQAEQEERTATELVGIHH